MDNVETKVIFEHPLNEKMRTWLRIEFLINQLNNNKNFNKNNALLFFHSLSELLEITERNDIRGDLNKDIEDQKQKLSVWLNIPGVDTALLNELLMKLDHILSQLSTQPKMGQNLKDDKLLAAIRKRLTIPGGCCNFDLPSFHLWLQQPQEYRDKHVMHWLNNFSTLHSAISTYMQLVRQSSTFKPFSCSNNFYQNSCEVISLLRIRISLKKGVYPQVSGNAARYVIRFVALEQVENNIDNSVVEFELACC